MERQKNDRNIPNYWVWIHASEKNENNNVGNKTVQIPNIMLRDILLDIIKKFTKHYEF